MEKGRKGKSEKNGKDGIIVEKGRKGKSGENGKDGRIVGEVG